MPAALARPFQGVLLKNVWSDLDVQKFKKVRQSIAQGYVEGKTTEQIIRELRGTRAKGYEDASFSATGAMWRPWCVLRWVTPLAWRRTT